MGNYYNLIEEGWVPVEGGGRVSLERIFSDKGLRSLGGNPVHKLSILKLLLAIGQSAWTPEDDKQWQEVGIDGFCTKCRTYLETNRDLFYLYGEQPFLQMSVLKDLVDKKKHEPLRVSELGRNIIPDLPSDNDTILKHLQCNRQLDDAERAVFIVSLMNYSLGGKRVVKDVAPLTKSYTGKSNSAKSGPSLGGYVGYLNSCLWGSSILETVWLNLFSREALGKFRIDWKDQEIVPPWERMPEGEDDSVARYLKNSFMGTLLAMSRFVLLVNDGIIYCEGIQYPSHKDGWREPFLAFGDKDKMLWLDTSKKPWRNLTSLLAATFLRSQAAYRCPQISELLLRARTEVETIGIWSGGLKVRGNAGDQSVKQTDDFIESCVFLATKSLGEIWFNELTSEMDAIQKLANHLYGSIRGYHQDQKVKNDRLLDKALEEFWGLVEQVFPDVIDGCDNQEKRIVYWRRIATISEQIYDSYCPNLSARQMSAWAKNRVKAGRYVVKAQKEVDLA